MTQPKFSEVLRAAGNGYYAQFDPQRMMSQSQGNGQMVMLPYDSRSADSARSMRDMCYALAVVYEQHEKATS